MADISTITLPNGDTYNFKDILARQTIPFGVCDSTSTSTAFTATVPGITVLTDGTCVLLQNSHVTSASGFTININNLGAKPVYNNMATGNDITPTAPTRETTLFNINYTMLFIYSTTLVDGGCWILYRGYNANDNTIGYQLRTNSTVLKTADKSRYYRLFFTSADGTHWVPANTGTDNSATSAKTVNQRPINPFGRIIYYSHTTNLAAESALGATYCWSQYAFALGYSFNKTGAALTLTSQKPVYIKCAPQSDGSAIIDATTPYVQDLPSSEDGKIYIFLGIAYSATNVELYASHPVYEYKSGAIRLYTNALVGDTINPATATPIVAGTGAVGTSIKYAREDHVHPAQTTINGHTVNSDVPANAEFTDTTYESKTAASGGTDVSLVTTGEKYTWNNKGTYSKPSGGIPDSDIASAATWNAKGNGTITGITMNGSSKGTSGVVDLGTVITAHQDISGKADKSATVSNVAYNSTSKKITETINGTTSDVVTVATLKTDLALEKADVGLSNVDNVKQYSASNPPPYPVTSVNGATGAVTVDVPDAATATPQANGTAAVGTSTKYAKEDHVHPRSPTVTVAATAPTGAISGDIWFKIVT